MKERRNARNSLLIIALIAITIFSSCVTITFGDDKADPLPADPANPPVEQGFVTDDSGNTYYYDDNLNQVKGWLKLEDSKYYFDTETGVMAKGWQLIDGCKYYFDTETGVMAKDWQLIDGCKYYFKSKTGEMVTGWRKINDKKYFFDKKTGILFTGWHTIEGKKYYFDTSTGARCQGWKKINDKKYFFGKKTGVLFTGWHTIEGKKYYFDTSTGARCQGWKKINDKKYFFGKKTGVLFTGWHKLNGHTYYFAKKSGRMFTGWHTLNGHKYYFDKKSGHMYTSWHKIGKAKYYFSKKNGRMYKGLHKIGSYKYYFSKKTGKMMKGLQKIGKNIYKINSKGRVERVLYGNKKAICLTYDDGPAGGTQLIVDTLKANDAAATFFVVGNRAQMYSGALKNATAIGCQMASHTYQHKMLGTLDPSGIQWQMSESVKAIRKYSGQTPEICRTPGGELGSVIQANVGMPIILWSIDTLDWKTQSADSTYNAVVNGAYDGAIVLMHDLWDSTASASTRIIPELKRQGYQMVTIEEMALLKGKKLKAGEIYYSFQ